METISVLMCLHILHGLAIWHPLRQNLEGINRHAKKPEDVEMVQLCPHNNLSTETLKNIS